MVIGLHVGSENYPVDSVESMPGVKFTSSTASKAHRE